MTRLCPALNQRSGHSGGLVIAFAKQSAEDYREGIKEAIPGRRIIADNTNLFLVGSTRTILYLPRTAKCEYERSRKYYRDH